MLQNTTPVDKGDIGDNVESGGHAYRAFEQNLENYSRTYCSVGDEEINSALELIQHNQLPGVPVHLHRTIALFAAQYKASARRFATKAEMESKLTRALESIKALQEDEQLMSNLELSNLAIHQERLRTEHERLLLMYSLLPQRVAARVLSWIVSRLEHSLKATAKIPRGHSVPEYRVTFASQIYHLFQTQDISTAATESGPFVSVLDQCIGWAEPDKGERTGAKHLAETAAQRSQQHKDWNQSLIEQLSGLLSGK